MSKYDRAILLAGMLWGIIGLFTRALSAAGVTSEGVLILRSGGCGLVFLAAVLFKDPKLLKIRWQDGWLFFCFGILSLLFFTYCYYQSIALGSLSAACTLMYSAPVFVMLISLAVFHESFTGRKLAALVCALVGCGLVSGVLEDGGGVSLAGVVYGLLAGVGYAFYSVCIKALTNRGYSVLTINVYGWLLCTLGGLVLWGTAPAASGLVGGRNVLLTVGLILVSGVCPAFLYSYGLQKEEAGKGAVMASVEPVMASVMGFAVFHETPTALGFVGIALVLAAVVILNTGSKTKNIPAASVPHRTEQPAGGRV